MQKMRPSPPVISRPRFHNWMEIASAKLIKLLLSWFRSGRAGSRSMCSASIVRPTLSWLNGRTQTNDPPILSSCTPSNRNYKLAPLQVPDVAQESAVPQADVTSEQNFHGKGSAARGPVWLDETSHSLIYL